MMDPAMYDLRARKVMRYQSRQTGQRRKKREP